ncbi:MAG: pyridoxal 5'-phosphate synthase glutaminase subunit PdxT [Roseburia sp.]|nr:pyridoxal 5'-phosphate synthase glutaminase subunit PdxT [Roseburia sp.]
MKIGVLSVQGAFEEHIKVMEKLGAECVELRQKRDVDGDFDRLILPGGESTVQGKLIRELDMYDGLKQRIEEGMPVLATCAGLILLAEHIVADETVHFGTLPVVVRRNAYGRQLGSFFVREEFGGLGQIPMTFIRAPYIESAEPGVEVLAKVDGNIVGVRYKNQIGVSFHPELDESLAIHRMFINIKIKHRNNK